MRKTNGRSSRPPAQQLTPSLDSSRPIVQTAFGQHVRRGGGAQPASSPAASSRISSIVNLSSHQRRRAGVTRGSRVDRHSPQRGSCPFVLCARARRAESSNELRHPEHVTSTAASTVGVGSPSRVGRRRDQSLRRVLGSLVRSPAVRGDEQDPRPRSPRLLARAALPLRSRRCAAACVRPPAVANAGGSEGAAAARFGSLHRCLRILQFAMIAVNAACSGASGAW